MKIFLIENKKKIVRRRKKIAPPAVAPCLTDENLRKMLRRAFKNISVPSDLETKVRNLIDRQF